jgi:hypothetical protein
MAAIASISTVQEAFERFEAGVVRIPTSEDAAAQQVHPEMRQTVRSCLRSLLLDDFLSGSYSRRVQVAPRLKDIDIVLVLADPTGVFHQSATVALRTIQAAALSCELVRAAEIRCRSVRAYLHDHEFTLDLVAALEPNAPDGLLLARRMPELGLDDWSWGNPRGQREAAVQKNDACGGMYRPAVRLVKFWKNGASPEFKSYHAESILFHALPGALAYDQALVCFFDAAYEQLAPNIHTEDPGAPGTYVDERLEDHERRAARVAVDTARKHAYAAIAATSTDEALEHWARVFGPSFPAPSSSRDSVANSLQQRTAGVAGLGLTPHRGPRTVQPRSWRRQG